MPERNTRYMPTTPPRLAEGWSIERLASASGRYGANGLRSGPDGHLSIAVVSSAAESARVMFRRANWRPSVLGGDIVGPDDLVFDEDGNRYVTEFVDAQVSVRKPNGDTRVLRSDVPGAERDHSPSRAAMEHLQA